MKKEDDVAVDDHDDDVVRTSVSQNRVINCSSGLSIYSSLHISVR
jgi:hypothetical protein